MAGSPTPPKPPWKNPIKRRPGPALILTALALLAASRAPFKDPGAIQIRSHVLAGALVPYALYLPAKLPRDRPAPLLVALHALGSSPLGLLSTPGLTQLAERHGIIVLAPEGHNPEGWYGSLGEERFRGRPAIDGALSERDVLEVLAIARRDFDVDSRRIVLMGHSMGGGGALHLGGKYPQLWAGVAAVAPAYFQPPERLAGLKSVPTLVIQGSDDAVIPAAKTRALVAALRGLGVDCRYREVAGDHAAPVGSEMAEVFAFLSARARAQ